MTTQARFTLLPCLLFGYSLATDARAARPIDLVAGNAPTLAQQLDVRTGGTPAEQRASIARAFALADGEELQLLRSRVDFNGVAHRRYRQAYANIPFWGAQVVVSAEPDGRVRTLHGRVVRGLAADVGPLGRLASLDPERALQQKVDEYVAQVGARPHQVSVRNQEAGLYICLDGSDHAYLCYVVSFFIDSPELDPSQPIFFVDARTGLTVDGYNMLRHADGTGPGGNVKIGQYEYGTDFPAFGVTQSGSTCTMDTADVRTVNLNHGTSGSTPFSYPCFRNTHKEINGAYSPLNDAQFFGQVVFDMFNDWYGVPPLPFKLTLRCHYSNSYENAFWDGSTMTFGDGATKFHPLVSLDVVAHEVSHGFTDYNSDLIYSNQSGGINEAFSDMAGEAGEFYMRGSNDFEIGYDIFKDPDGALRYMYDPPLDGNSIGHVNDYVGGMNVHYSSGVFNKAFYLIATSSGWTVQKAFDIFVKANQDYWTPSTNFQQGAEGVRDATADYGYSCADVRDAFAVVGITLDCGGTPGADFTFVTYPGNRNASFTDASTCSSCSVTDWSWDFGDGNTSTAQNPTHTYVSDGTYTVTLTVTSDTAETDSVSKPVTVPKPVAGLPYTTGFEGGVLDDFWSVSSSTGAGRIEVTTANGPRTGSYHLTMDVSQNGTYNTNGARLRLDLSGETNVELRFWWKEFSDENHSQDGVFFSDDDGSSFVKVLDLTGGSTTWAEKVLDVDQLAAANGLTLTESFVVLFQQHDNYGITTDGFAFDDISVSGGGGGGGCTTIYTQDFEAGAGGWAFDSAGSTCTTGDWGVGDPDYVSNGGVVTQLEDDHTASGTQAFFTEPNTGGAGTNDVDGGVCVGYSGIIDASAHPVVELSLWYYHGQRDAGDDAGGDYFSIDLSTDGGSSYSQNLVSIGDVTSNAAWTQVKVNVSDPGQLRIRVQASDGSGPGDLVEGGIDDVVVCVPE